MSTRSDIWSGSTSARPRSPRSSARSWTTAASTSSASGLAESKGIRRGVVNNVDSAAEAIKRALDEAELTAGVEIDSVHLALSGAHVKAFNSRGVVAVAGRNREITREDVKRAIDAARAVALPGGREILHVLPQDFVVDDQDGIGVPVGMTGSRLEVNVHVVTGSSSSMQNMIACVNRAGVEVVDTVLEQLAASEAVLTPDEKELGVCARRHRRRHDGLRGVRARQPVAHGRAAPSAAITSPTTSRSACGCRFPTPRSSSAGRAAR